MLGLGQREKYGPREGQGGCGGPLDYYIPLENWARMVIFVC